MLTHLHPTKKVLNSYQSIQIQVSVMEKHKNQCFNVTIKIMTWFVVSLNAKLGFKVSFMFFCRKDSLC